MIKLSDYMAARIAGLGVRHVFLITGGGAMHLDDSLGRRDDLHLIFDHHEQACAIAAEGYARIGGTIAVVVVTTGPGGTNTLTGVLGQWHDSVPVLYVSGQVRFDTTVASTHLPLRQLGDQEADIVRLVAPITKYAAMVTRPETVRYHFEKAVWLAQHGRPGPVWLDVPFDVQAALVDEATMPAFDPAELDDVEVGSEGRSPVVATAAVAAAARVASDPVPSVAPQPPGAFMGAFDREAARAQAQAVVERLRRSERPVLMGGSGVRTAGAAGRFLTLADTLDVPVVTAWNAHDLMYEEHPLYVGRPGTIGDRAGNFAVQNADLLLVVGCRLNVRQIGYEFRAFARAALKVVVDIDEAELLKPTVQPDLAVHADAGFFIDELSAAARTARGLGEHDAWLEWCLERRRRYPVVLPEYAKEHGAVNPYVFVDRLSVHLEPGDVVICANGAACVVGFQALRLKPGQRLLGNSGTAGMGYDLPAAIGAALASSRRVVCLAGDGSVQMNIQELQTIVHHGLPVKMFIFDNAGYVSIRQTQDNLFAGRRVGEGPATGLSLPDMVAVAAAYGIEARRVDDHAALDAAIAATLAGDVPSLCDVVMPAEAVFAPKVAAERTPDGRIVSKPLEDMTPLLDRREFADNMIVPQWEPD